MKLHELTAHEAFDLLKKKEISSTELTREMISRIEAVDTSIGSYLTTTFEEAVATAEEVDKKIAAGEQLAPLAGVPAAIKDNICTKGVKTTCASKMLENFVSPYDAFAVQKLKDAGAPILGKLNMDEFAMGSSTEHSYFKITKNPFDTSRVPGGSSGGSAAAVSAGLAFYTLGSDTGGSVRQPASFCGVVGLKPTYGRVSRYGLVAFASSLDQIGPICKDVTDAAMVLSMIAGHDAMDPTSAQTPPQDYTNALSKDVKGLKIGVPSWCLEAGVCEQIKQKFLDAVKVYEGLGASVEYISMDTLKYALPAYYIISSAEASCSLARFNGVTYGYRSQNYENWMDLYKNTRAEGFGDEVKKRIIFGTFALSSGNIDAYYKKALQVRTIICREFDEAFEKYDVILMPTSPSGVFEIGDREAGCMQTYSADAYTVPASLAGLPAISIPCGFDKEGLPVGMQLVGKAFDEATILRAAYAFEQSTEYSDVRPNL